jgi:hypothetical protein
MPTRPTNVNEIISKYIKARVPHFFMYAKDKEEGKVEVLNNSVVNMLETIIPNKRIHFVKVAGKLNYRMLMKNSRVKLDEEMINTYEKLDKNKKWMSKRKDNNETNEILYIYKVIREEILKINNDIDYVVDVLVKYLYQKKSSRKDTLWKSFGDVLYANLCINLENTKQCECCGVRIEVTSNRSKYCDDCWKVKQKELKRKWWNKNKLLEV